MKEIPLSTLIVALLVLLLLSAFFSASETAMMSLNRYRLRHLAKKGHGGAIRTQSLLDKPDRLIGFILLGNNFVNILASALATLVSIRLFGDAGIAVVTALLTVIIILFAEVTPKTLAAMRPERVAFPASYIFVPMIRFTAPLVWAVSTCANSMLKAIGIRPTGGVMQQLSRDELKTIVHEAGALIPDSHQQMLLGILDLEQITAEDVMVPRNDIFGIDLSDEVDNIIDLLSSNLHTRLPVYNDDINNVVGILHMRDVLHSGAVTGITKEKILSLVKEPYYIPEGTPLNQQLLNFQREKRRLGLVVNEYGDIAGLLTLEDILEEIVGKFTTETAVAPAEIIPEPDGSHLLSGSLTIRELNRTMKWELPTQGPKTLNGLILEYLETIPEPGTTILINDYPIEIVQIADNAVKVARLHPRLQRGAGTAEAPDQ